MRSSTDDVTNMSSKPRLLRAYEVAKRFDVSEARVYEMARLGLLPTVRLGRQCRFDAEALEQWVQGGGQAFEGGWRKDGAI